MSHLVLRGDARRIPLADGSVDLIVTSPPYWAQRSYRDAGDHYSGQLGSESHPRLWLEAMFEVMKECWRVLAPGGSVFVNLGDKRAGSGGHNNSNLATSTIGKVKFYGEVGSARATRRNAPDRYEQAHFGRRKSRQLLPERFAIGCEDGLADPEGIGWIVRQIIVWQKANGLPESVTDRTRDDFEYIYHLVKSDRYFTALDELREPLGGQEPFSECDPLCSLCGRPPHSLPSHVAGRDELNGRVVPINLPNQVRTNQGVDPQGLSHAQDQSSLGLQIAFGEPLLMHDEAASLQDQSASVDDPLITVGDSDVEVRVLPRSGAESDTTLSIDDAGQPSEVCLCVCHTSILTQKRGALPGSVWRIASEPLRIPDWAREKYGLTDHFAAMPTEIPRRLILGFSPSGICTACNEPRRPVVEKTYEHRQNREGNRYADGLAAQGSHGQARPGSSAAPDLKLEATIIGYACRCPDTSAPTSNAVVLDMFGGTGTTALVAETLGRTGISLDLSADYCNLARWRIEESQHGRKAEQRTWAEAQGQMF